MQGWLKPENRGAVFDRITEFSELGLFLSGAEPGAARFGRRSNYLIGMINQRVTAAAARAGFNSWRVAIGT